MKTTIKSLIASLTLIFSSCSGFLDVKPSVSLPTDDAFETIKDAEVALNGIYTQLQHYVWYGSYMALYGDIKGDDMQCTTDGARLETQYRFQETPNTNLIPQELWNKPYSAIRQANNLLYQLEGKTLSGATEVQTNDIRGKALALRGLALFDLTRLFGRPYTQDNGESPGVPVVTEAVKPDYQPGRQSVRECYEQIIRDFEEAITLMSDEKKTGEINKYGAMALLSRVYLYQGNWKLALHYAEEVIQNSDYRLWNRDEYSSVWGKEGTSEVIFEIVMTQTNNIGTEAPGYLLSKEGYNAVILTEAFTKLIQSDPDDIRNLIIKSESAEGKPFDNQKVYLLKYPGKEGMNVTINNINVIRLSEVYLNAAEAAFKTGDSEKALTYLNAIATRANPAAVTTDISLERILNERRKELAGEGHRFFDAVRNGINIERSGGWHLILNPESQIIKTDDHKIVLPIPQSEFNANANMTQNPGY